MLWLVTLYLSSSLTTLFYITANGKLHNLSSWQRNSSLKLLKKSKQSYLSSVFSTVIWHRDETSQTEWRLLNWTVNVINSGQNSTQPQDSSYSVPLLLPAHFHTVAHAGLLLTVSRYLLILTYTACNWPACTFDILFEKANCGSFKLFNPKPARLLW